MFRTCESPNYFTYNYQNGRNLKTAMPRARVVRQASEDVEVWLMQKVYETRMSKVIKGLRAACLTAMRVAVPAVAKELEEATT